jgi:hypothetical protein
MRPRITRMGTDQTKTGLSPRNTRKRVKFIESNWFGILCVQCIPWEISVWVSGLGSIAFYPCNL